MAVNSRLGVGHVEGSAREIATMVERCGGEKEGAGGEASAEQR